MTSRMVQREDSASPAEPQLPILTKAQVEALPDDFEVDVFPLPSKSGAVQLRQLNGEQVEWWQTQSRKQIADRNWKELRAMLVAEALQDPDTGKQMFARGDHTKLSKAMSFKDIDAVFDRVTLLNGILLTQVSLVEGKVVSSTTGGNAPGTASPVNAG